MPFLSQPAAATVVAFLLCATATVGQEAKSIYEVGKDNDADFGILVDAVDAAGADFVDLLSDDDETLTLFAPLDTAFEDLPDGLVGKLLEEEWKPQLRDLLLFHLLDSVVGSTDIQDGMNATTMNGDGIMFSLNPPRVNAANLVEIDIEASNGLIHSIDSVLLPASVNSNVVDIAMWREDLSTLVNLLNQTGLAADLGGNGPFTIFAPTNDAFDELSQDMLEALRADEAMLTNVLQYHAVPLNLDRTSLSERDALETLNGDPVTISMAESGVKVNDARVLNPNIIASNGIVHVVDSVLIPPTPKSIYEIIENDADFGTLVAAVDAAGADFVDLLSNDNETLTLFAPPDTAFEDLPDGLVEQLLEEEWKPQLRDLLLFHLLDFVVGSTEIQDGMNATTMNGDNIIFSLDPPRVNAATLVEVDTEASNGLIHSIDSVLLPASVNSNVVDIAMGREDLSILVNLLNQTGLAADLGGNGPFTIFAPTNDAFDELSQDMLEALRADEAMLTNVLQYHAVPLNLDQTSLSEGDVLETLNGDSVTISMAESGVKVNDARVLDLDIIANNGIVHVVDSVLIPPTAAPTSMPTDAPKSIYEIIENDADFGTLVAAVDAAGAEFVRVLSDGEATLTLFAPLNAAFEDLPDGLVEKLLEEEWNPQLRDLLLYHVLAFVADSTMIEDGLNVTTLNEEMISFSLGPPRVNGANLLDVDIKASNGLVHVIDSVLQPTSVDSTVVDIATGRDDLSTLVELVVRAELAGALADEGPFTVLAPNNDAFNELSQDTLEALLADKDMLANVLSYHVVPLNLDEFLLSERDAVVTLNGESVTISVTESAVKVNDARVLDPNIIANNGIVHVIDSVLIPPSDVAPTNMPTDTPKSIYEIGMDNAGDGFGSLVAAVDAAGFAEFLSDDDETLTLFAPLDNAFEELPDGLVEKLFDEEWKPQLRDLLLYHLLDFVVGSTEIRDGMSATTMNGESISFSLDPSLVNGYSNLLDVDTKASNGLVHVIDSVLLPASVNSNVVDIASGRGDLSTLVELVNRADLAEALAGDGPFTLFAPNDDAFSGLAQEVRDALLADQDLLTDVLMYHAVPANVDEMALASGDIGTLETLNGDSVTISLTKKSRIEVNDARILDPDTIASNGIVHVIDSVLIPPSGQTTMSSSSKSAKPSKRSKVSKASKRSKGRKNSKKWMKSKKSKSEESDSSTESSVGSGESAKSGKTKSGKSKSGKSAKSRKSAKSGKYDKSTSSKDSETSTEWSETSGKTHKGKKHMRAAPIFS